MRKPNEPGYWWANGVVGRKLFVVARDLEHGGLLVRLADAIHGWPLWFNPRVENWKYWKKLKPE